MNAFRGAITGILLTVALYAVLVVFCYSTLAVAAWALGLVQP